MRKPVLALALALLIAFMGTLGPAEGAVPDGVYPAGTFRFSGGSGRVTISCASVRVEAGRAWATIAFSSPNYPTVAVNGERYAGEHPEGRSVFEIPVNLDGETTILATTTAMSAPHEIEYTLWVSLDGPEAAEESAPEVDGESAPAETALPDPPETLAGLRWESALPLRVARQFRVDYYAGGYKLLTLGDGSRFLVIPEGQEPPEGLDGDIRPLRRPLGRIYLAATSAMALFDAVDALDTIAFSSLRRESWTVERAAEAMDRGEIVYAGKYSAPDYELLLSGGCDLAVESTMILHSPKVREMLERLGIPVLIDRSSYETHPLGRTEWVKLYAALTDREAEAEAFFDAQAAVIDALKDFPNTGKTVAFFYVSTDGRAVVRNTGDYIPAMIELAGGRYVFDQPPAPGSSRAAVSIGMEDFYRAAVDADYLVYNAAVDAPLTCVADLLGKSPLFADFRAVKEGRVWTTGKQLYQATDTVGSLIADFHRMLTGEESGMMFLTKLEP